MPWKLGLLPCGVYEHLAGAVRVQGRDAMKEALEREEHAELWQRIYDVTLDKMTSPSPGPADAVDAPPSPLAGMQSGA